MSRAIALLAGLGAGYMDEKDRQAERDRRARLDQITIDEADARKADRKRQNDDRDALRAAAAPVPVVPEGGLPDTMDNRDVGQEGEAPVAPKTYRVGARQFASQGLADDAATAQRRQNVAAVQETQDPTGAPARELQGMQLSAAKRDQMNQMFDEGLNQASTKGIQAVLDFTNASGASPTQSRFVLGPDGKSGEVHVTLPDGTDRATGMQFTNDAAGARNMALFLSQKTPLAAKLQHFQAEAESARKAKTDEADIKLKGAQAGYYDSLNQTKLDIAANKSAAGGGRKADHFDEKEWDAAAKIEPSFVSFDDSMGGKAVESPELRLVYRTELNAARARGDAAPNEAAESARTTTLKLRNAAIDRVAAAKAADKNSTLTEGQAVRAILKEFQDSQRPKPAPSVAPPAGVPTPAARAAQGVAQPAPPAQEQIPGPPPQTMQQGLSTVPNPAYADWAARFGKAWSEQQAAQAQASGAAADAAKASFNPYNQNRVR